MTEKMKQFRNACKLYLTSLSIGALRSYGRSIGVARPTDKKKEDLIEAIIGVFTGELLPIPISKHGAPVKNDRVDERIPLRMEALKAEFFTNDVMIEVPEFDFQKEYAAMMENQKPLRLNDPKVEEEKTSKAVLRGQVCCVEGSYFLLPLDCDEEAERVFLPTETVSLRGIREGDILSYYARKNSTDGTLIVDNVITMNDLWADEPPVRPHFDDCLGATPNVRIRLYSKDKYVGTSLKFIDWLMPVVKGQRGCIISSPKAGKTHLLLEIAKAANALNGSLETFVLLVDQSPETVGQFRRFIGEKQLFYTTYMDDPERQVFVADFLLQRAKRMAESGKDVLILLDSLTALAHAFNDTEASMGGKTLSCGLEIKTVRYIKKYFGAAKCLEKGGSLTILGTVTTDTGNPFDDVVAAEFSSQANYEIRLDNGFAMRRIYPAIDFVATRAKGSEVYKEEWEEEFDFFLRNEALAKLGGEKLLSLLSQAKSYDELIKLTETAVKE